MRCKLFGGTGLRGSELFLGARTFGEQGGVGAPPQECTRILGAHARASARGRCYRHGQALTSVTISNPVSSGGAVKPPSMPRCMLGISTESRKFSKLAFES